VFVIAAIVIVMAVLIAIPNISQQPAAKDITIDYTRQHMRKTDAGKGLIVTSQVETLSIDKDGSATYKKTDSTQKNSAIPQQFSLNRDDFTKIKSLVLDTGFMDIPKTDYVPSQNASQFVSYTLSIKTQESQRTINWVEPDAYNGTIPPLITNIGTQLDGVIASKP
jgi:hypothetical protein